MADIASLQITVTQQGVDQVKSDLTSVGASGEAAAERVGSAFKASGETVQRAMAQQGAAVERAAAQQQPYISGTEGLIAAQKRWLAELPPLTAEQQRLTQATQLSTAEINKAVAAYDRLIASQQASVYTQQAVIKAEIEAYAIQEKMSAGAQLHGLQLGRLNQELGTFIGRLTGANTAVTRLSAQIGGAVLGYGSMIAILGGVALAIAAVEAVYNAFTEDTRKAKEENEKLLKVLDEIAKRRTTTEAGNTRAAIAAGQERLALLQKQLADAEAQARAAELTSSRSGEGLAFGFASVDPAAAQKAVDAARNAVAQGEAELTALIKKSAEDRDRIITSDIAAIVRSGQATAAQIENARRLLTGYQQSLTALQKAGSSDTATLVELTSKIKDLNDALYPKQRTTGSEKLPTNEVIVALEKQLDEMRKVEAENQTAALHDRQAAEAAGAHGVSLELLNVQHKAEADALKAVQTVSGVALTERLKQIDASEKEGEKLVYLNEQIRNNIDLAKKVKAAPLPSDQQAEAIVKAFEDAKRARDAFAQEITKGIADDLSSAIAQGFHDGFKSAEDFANSVINLFEKIAARAAALKIGQVIFGGGGLGRTAEEDAAYHTKPVGGGPTAFDRDQLSTFAVTAGAVIGVANAMNTLTGASRNSAAALQSLAESYTHFVTGTRPAIEALAAQLNSAPIDSQLQQIDALRNQVEQDLAGKRLEATREAALRQLDALEQQRIKQLQEEAAALRLATSQSYTVRLQRAQGNTTAANDLEFNYGQAKEIQDFIKQFGPFQTDLLNQLLEVLNAEKGAYEQAKKDAEAAKVLANTQAQEDFKVRQLQAEGHTEEADALRLQLAQQREYADAVKAGLDDATLAALKLAQTAESAAAAAAKAQEQQRALDDLQVRQLQAQGNTQEADNLRFQLQQQRELEDAIKAGQSQDYIDKLKEVLALEAQARTNGVQTGPVTNTGTPSGGSNEAVVYAAKALTEATGNRMADYLSAILIVERQQLDVMRGGLSGPRFLPPVFSQPVPSQSGLTASDVDKLILGINKGSQSSSTSNKKVEITVRVEGLAGNDTDAIARRLAPAIAERVQGLLADEFRDEQIRSGDPSRIGF